MGIGVAEAFGDTVVSHCIVGLSRERERSLAVTFLGRRSR